MDKKRLAVLNIAKLAASAYDGSRNATKRTSVALSMIAALNHQEVKDYEIAQHLCNPHKAAGIRAEAIQYRAESILNCSVEGAV